MSPQRGKGAGARAGDGGRGDATEYAYREIRQGIVEGRHGQGEPLTEAALSAELGVSRTPVRTALGRLVADGLVEQLPNRRAIVARWSGDELEEIFGLRAVLESYGARLAARRAEPGEIAELERLCDRMEETLERREPGWLAECTELNNAFHHGVLALSGNRRLIAFVSSIVEVPLTHRTIGGYTIPQLEHSWAGHREMTAALRKGDEDWAESIMRAHILTGRNIMVHGSEHPAAYELDPLADPPVTESIR